LIIQVPLQLNPTIPRSEWCALTSSVPDTTEEENNSIASYNTNIGKEEGTFLELNGRHIERDSRVPIRVTMQFYRCLDDGYIDDDIMSDIFDTLAQSRSREISLGRFVEVSF
jgi:hypothetical protein